MSVDIFKCLSVDWLIPVSRDAHGVYLGFAKKIVFFMGC
jgi:hypothetical protein